MNLIVGSGPAGVAAAIALLERGKAVTMIDVGRELEPEFAAIPRPVADLPYEQWPRDTIARLAAITGPIVGGLPRKTNFGSDFATRDEPELLPLDVRNAEILSSLARGGLSNLWGANVFSFCADDLKGWPFGVDALEASYRAVLAHVPLSAGRDDDFTRDFPLHSDRIEPRLLSRQAQAILADLVAGEDRLHALGFRFGPSRLGIQTADAPGRRGCVRCGFCLNGCPIDVIYNSAHTLEHLRRDPRFRYESGLYAQRFVESGSGVELHAVRVADRAPVRFQGARLFLGCGGYSTARLILESLQRYSQELTMLESQYFLTPMIYQRGLADLAAERLQTLSQICLRLRDPQVCANDVQMLIYTYSPLYRPVIARSPAGLLPPLVSALANRMLALQGYLHSDDSPRLALRLVRRSSGPHALEVEGHPRPDTRATVRRIVARIGAIAPQLRARPIPFMTKIAPPGKSYHGGGIFPMNRTPEREQSDMLGRPWGLARVHVVDSSVFPTIPATNLTLSVMANAHRIAGESCALEAGAAGAPPEPIPA